jgi:uracil-DNA glycosylase
VERVMEELTPEAAASALAWWLDAGVDVIVGEEPRDWLRAKPPTAPLETKSLEPRVAAEPQTADELPDQLDLFQAWLRTSDRVPFASPAAQRVCPAGDPAAGLMIVIDMPSAEDCAAGTLLTGEVGRLFDRMLAAIGRDRGSIYLAALSCLRSPDGRLTGAPAQQCATLARHHIGLVAPKALLLLGDACAKALLGLSMVQARGRWHEVATHAGPIRTLVTIPPDFLLRQPGHKARAWADLQMLIEEVRR